MNRLIKYLVVHCTATAQNAKPEAIQNYWKNDLKWTKPGYHILIDATGKKHRLLQDEEVGNGVYGYNQSSLHVSYIGGLDNKDTRTESQKDSIWDVLQEWKNKYPQAIIKGHREFPNVEKTCPNFIASIEYKEIKAK